MWTSIASRVLFSTRTGLSNGPFRGSHAPAAVTTLVRRRPDLYNILLLERAESHCWLVCLGSHHMAGRQGGGGQGLGRGGLRMSLASPGPGVKGASFWTPNRYQNTEAGQPWLSSCKTGDLSFTGNLSVLHCSTKIQLPFDPASNRVG